MLNNPTTKQKSLILTLVILQATCSRVIDKYTQALYVSDYCSKIGECVEGSHVMCTHYNPNKEMGPLCIGTEKVSITDEYAEILLNLMNGIRSRAAKGMTSGYERQKLPRGYGIFRLQWDPELATFAQLWANQCIIDNDRCRATKKFPDPGQLVVLTLFTEPDWLLLSRREYFNETGFNLKKVKYSLSSSIRSWYTTKRSIDADIILGHKWSANLHKNPYLQLVKGSATHVGCGISVFKAFVYFTDTNDLIFNMVRLVCNFSTRVRESQIYTTDPPTAVGYTVKCGCPLGYDEDADCLCYESGRGLPFSCKYGQCKPHVVVLPIFSVEYAPPHEVMAQQRQQGKNMALKKGNQFYLYNSTHAKRHAKSSLFSKSSIFKLSSRRLIETTKKDAKKNIIPLRNLTNLSHSGRYINEGRDDTEKHQTDKQNMDLSRTIFKEPLEIYSQEDYSHDDFNRLSLRNSSQSSLTNFPVVHHLNVNLSKQNAKVIDLLTKLEHEAKHIRIDETSKDILYQKLQNIFNTFAEKLKSSQNNIINRNHINLVETERDKLDEFEDEVKRINERDNNIEPIIKDRENYSLRSNGEIFHIRKNNDINLVGMRNIFDVKEKARKDTFNNIMENESLEEDLLSLNKRKYYQNKLNQLERKIHNLRNVKNRRVVRI